MAHVPSARERSLAVLTRALEEIEGGRPPAEVLTAEVLGHAERLTTALGDAPEDAPANLVAGWIHWHHAVGGGGEESLGRAVTAFAPCLVYGVGPLPEPLLPDIADHAAVLAYDLLAQVLGSPGPETLRPVTEAWRRIVAATPPDEPERPVRLCNLGIALRNLAEWSPREPDLITRAVAALDEAVRTAGDPVPRATYRSNLADALLFRFERDGDVDDLNRAVDAAREAVRDLPDDDHAWATVHGVLAAALQLRHDRTWNAEDLDEAIEVLERIVRRAPAAMHLANLGTALRTRYQRFGRPTDLARMIEVGEQAVAATPAGHHKLGARLSTLALALRTRFEVNGDRVDLDRAVELGEQAVDATPAGHPDRPGMLSNLGLSLRMRFELAGERDDLDRALRLGAQAVAAAEEGHADRAMYLANLAAAWQRRFEATRNPEDLDRALAACDEAAHAAPDDHPDHGVIQANRCVMLMRRYELYGELADLDQAIGFGERAVRATPPGHLNQASVYATVGAAVYHRFERTADERDIDRAVFLLREAEEHTGPDHPDMPTIRANLASALWLRYTVRGEAADLEEALRAAERAVKATPADHPERARRLAALALALRARFERTGDRESIDRAVALGEQALAAVPTEHPTRANLATGLGGSLMARFARFGTAGDLERAREVCTAAAAVPGAPVRHLLQARRGEGQAALALGDGPGALAAFEAAVGMLPQLVPGYLRRGDREHGLGTVAGLGAEAAAAAVAAGRPERAVELLERTRGVLAAEVMAADEGVAELAAKAPDLVAEFRRIRAERDRLDHEAASPSDLPSSPRLRRASALMYERTRRLGAERRRLAAEWDNLIARIRRRPGLAGFLHPPSFAEIGAAAADGPVVAVCATPLGGLALLLTADDDRPAVRALPLPEATERKCRDRADRLSAAFTILGDRKASDEEKNAARDEANEVLGWLWDAITGPILDTLAAGGWQGGRLWWCPVGLTARLPLHAAGRAGAPGALDRVVSSYTPTIQALARSRARRTADTDEAPAATALVVAMSRTPNHPALDAASYEAERVRELVRNVTVLRDTEATGQAVLRELARHRIAHFACHSVSDRADPAKGRLLLHDHTTSPLTVAEIMRTRLPRNAELAYLSACRTADAGPRLADEAIHLTGAFQLAGYRHVIGTLWPVYDLISAIVAENVYRRLTRDGTTPPDTNTTASALRAAIRDLRETHPSRPDLWAGYVHVGP